MVRRRGLPIELEAPFAAFAALVDELEPARDGLTKVVPTTRLPGMPLPDALHDYEAALVQAAESMPAWRHESIEEAWRDCDRGIAEARARARRFREEPPHLEGFESLIWAVEHLLDPLAPFEEAAEAFRSLRRSRSRA